MPQRETLTVHEAAAIIGVCAHTLYTMVRTKQIPHVKARRRILFRYTAIMSWMADQESKNLGA